MSYDLMVFEPGAVPSERRAFLDWYDRVMEEEGDFDPFDPATTAPGLRAWYFDMLERFPAMNGPQAVAEDDPAFDTPWITGYSFSPHAIYVDFRWDVAEQAYKHGLALAAKHDVGFYDVSDPNGAVWLPQGRAYRIAHAEGDAAPKDKRAPVFQFFRRKP
ncbi:hypothetical protein L2U69_05090 [Zavarzinia compransoris]|uniref:hypothetical protein n=1 Tax=Zavarzinia marina TaxID=2911065 RepID=UPI001F334B6C|nr:hypothetical protein [Zavarzinia marina]MCF4165013.1 hypothetical protein [Zavarzinia marina]